MTTASAGEAIAQILSPTQATTFLHCPAKWYFRYLLDLPEPATGALALGSAFHATLAQNFRQKIQSKQDLPVGELTEAFTAHWAAASERAEFRDDECPSDLEQQGRALVDLYLREAAPFIEPAAVEMPVQGEINGVTVRGFVDLMDTDGNIIDCKTAAKRPNGVSPDHALQLSTYVMLTPGSSGVCRLDTVTKTKTVQLIQQVYEAGPEEQRYAAGIYPMVQDAVREGIYLPHRASMLCSRKHCGYWRECEREFGGKVKAV